MPNKSHASETVTSPSRPVVQEIYCAVEENHSSYKHLPEIVQRVNRLK